MLIPLIKNHLLPLSDYVDMKYLRLLPFCPIAHFIGRVTASLVPAERLWGHRYGHVEYRAPTERLRKRAGEGVAAWGMSGQFAVGARAYDDDVLEIAGWMASRAMAEGCGGEGWRCRPMTAARPGGDLLRDLEL